VDLLITRAFPLFPRWCGTLLIVLLVLPPSLKAAEWPERPIEIFVASRVGGALDTMARGLAKHLAARVEMPVVVRNQPGGMTSVATAAMLRRDADGHALLVTVTSPYLVNSLLNLDVTYSLDDFVVVNDQWSSAEAIHVHQSLADTTLREMLEQSRSTPGRFSAGVFVRSGGHAGLSRLIQSFDMGPEHFRVVFFDSGSQLRAALAGGHLDMAVMPLESVEPIQGYVETRAVFASDRQEGYLEVPTIGEVLGNIDPDVVEVPGFVRSLLVASRFAMQHPERYEALVEHLEAIVHSSDFREEMAGQLVGTQWHGPQKSTANLNTAYLSLQNFLVASQEPD
jgi:putative tricarboxylic transport membrane protein